jgi:hypothetical protein
MAMFRRTNHSYTLKFRASTLQVKYANAARFWAFSHSSDGKELYSRLI